MENEKNTKTPKAPLKERITTFAKEYGPWALVGAALGVSYVLGYTDKSKRNSQRLDNIERHMAVFTPNGDGTYKLVEPTSEVEVLDATVIDDTTD